MRIVLDTNILVRAATGPRGPAGEVLRLVDRPPHLLILSPFLLSELSRALSYERLRRIHQLDDESLQRYIRELEANALVVGLSHNVLGVVVPHDPDDDPIVATAVAGRADVICTRDKHLHHADVQAYCASHGVRVMTDLELLPELRRESGDS